MSCINVKINWTKRLINGITPDIQCERCGCFGFEKLLPERRGMLVLSVHSSSGMDQSSYTGEEDCTAAGVLRSKRLWMRVDLLGCTASA